MANEKLVEKLLDTPISRLFALFLVFIVMACPGALGIAVFKPEIFAGIDIPRMLLISAAISVPVFMINITAGVLFWFAVFGDVRHREQIEASGIEDTTPDDPESIVETAVVIGSVASLVPLYVPILIRVFAITFTLRKAIATVALVESIVFIGMIYATWKIFSGRFRDELKRLKELREARTQQMSQKP